MIYIIKIQYEYKQVKIEYIYIYIYISKDMVQDIIYIDKM